MMLTRTQFIFTLTCWYVKVCYGDWVQISHTLSKPKVEEVTKPTVIRRFSTTTTTTTTTTEAPQTLATTQLPTTESMYNNLTFGNQFKRRTSTDHMLVKERIENSKPSFAAYIENVQETLMKRNHKTVKNKVDLLTDLKDNLLFNIKNKISSLWSPKPENREARGYHDKEEESHMDFPSNEGALMTIGFLTFAVFLIKLVLKLITALKQKNNAMTTTTTVAPTVLFGRKKRDIDEEAIKILSIIDEFKYK